MVSYLTPDCLTDATALARLCSILVSIKSSRIQIIDAERIALWLAQECTGETTPDGTALVLRDRPPLALVDVVQILQGLGIQTSPQWRHILSMAPLVVLRTAGAPRGSPYRVWTDNCGVKIHCERRSSDR